MTKPRARRKRIYKSKSGKTLSEKSIQKEILDWLESTPLLHWRQNAGSLWLGGKFVRLGPAGLPDIIVIVPPSGRFLGLEVKSKTGKLRPAQEEFRDKLESAGGIYTVVRSLTDAYKAVEKAIQMENDSECLQKAMR